MARYSVKLLLAGILAFAGLAPAQAQNAYPLFEPATGILKGDTNTYVTTAAVASDIYSLWTGCSGTTFLRGDGACSLVNLTSNVTGTLPVGNGGTGVTSLGTLTDVDDTNVTLTLGGTPTNSLIRSVSITAGWTGQLSAARGGTGLSTVTDDTMLIANGTTWQSKAISDCQDTSGNHLNYNATTNTISCGTSSSVSPVSPANPTATIGLTAVNGTSPNFIRSDGAPALSQAIVPTWSGTHTYSQTLSGVGQAANIYSSVLPGVIYDDSDAGANTRYWVEYASGTSRRFTTYNDAASVERVWLQANRSTNTISSVAFGNATDNPAFSFLGTGTATFGGAINVPGTITGTNSTNALVLSSIFPQGVWSETDQGVDGKSWSLTTSSGAFRLDTMTDAGSITKNAFNFTRSGTAVSGLAFGNSTDNPTSTFNGLVAAASTSAEKLRLRAAGITGNNYLTFYENDNTTRKGYVGYGNVGDDVFFIANEEAANVVLQTSGTTRLTVGTSAFTGTLPWQGQDGAVGAPALSFSGDSDTGFYRGASGSVRYAADGVLSLNFTGTGAYTVDGNASNPSWSFINDSDTGIYRGAVNTLSFATGGAVKMGIDTGALTFGASVVTLGQAGSATAPFYSFESDTNTGLFSNGADNLRVTVGGASVVGFIPGQFLTVDGTASAPSHGFLNDTNTGMYSAAADSLGFATAGTNRVTMTNGVQVGAPTGGDKGSGTLNAASGLYQNNVAVCLSDGTNCPASTLSRVFKSSTTSRSSTTTLTADPDLQFTAAANAVYKLYACLQFNGTTTGTQGIKIVLNRTSAGSNTGFWTGAQYIGTTGTAIAGVGTPSSPGTVTGQVAIATIDVSSSVSMVCLNGAFSLSTGVGYAIEWAQNSSNANATNMLAGSFLEYSRVN